RVREAGHQRPGRARPPRRARTARLTRRGRRSEQVVGIFSWVGDTQDGVVEKTVGRSPELPALEGDLHPLRGGCRVAGREAERPGRTTQAEAVVLLQLALETERARVGVVVPDDGNLA